MNLYPHFLFVKIKADVSLMQFIINPFTNMKRTYRNFLEIHSTAEIMFTGHFDTTWQCHAMCLTCIVKCANVMCAISLTSVPMSKETQYFDMSAWVTMEVKCSWQGWSRRVTCTWDPTLYFLYFCVYILGTFELNLLRTIFVSLKFFAFIVGIFELKLNDTINSRLCVN